MYTEALTTITPVLPATTTANPVDLYINGLSSAKSMRTMRAALRGVVRLLADNGLAQIDPEAIDDEAVRGLHWETFRYCQMDTIRALLIRRYEPAGAMLYLAAVRGVLKRAWKGDLIDTESYSRAVELDPIKVHSTMRGRALEQREIEAILGACGDPEDFRALRDKAILAVLLFSGVRRNEIAMLDAFDYSADESSVRVRFGKGKKQRVTYMCVDGCEILERWLAHRESKAGSSFKPLFYGYRKDGTVRRERITDQTIYNVVMDRSRQAGLADVTPHDCRRTFATRLLEEGADLFLVQSLMGHESPSTTQKYDRRQEKGKREAVGLLSLKSGENDG